MIVGKRDGSLQKLNGLFIMAWAYDHVVVYAVAAISFYVTMSYYVRSRENGTVLYKNDAVIICFCSRWCNWYVVRRASVFVYFS